MERRAADICIDAPELMTRREQLRDKIMTGIMWALYAYLWLPLISLLAWILGFEFTYDVMVRAGGAAHLRTVLFWYGIAITSIFVVFGVWSVSNRRRFAGHNRRGNLDRVADESFMAYFRISAEELTLLRSGSALTLQLDAVGAICEIADGSSGSVAGANPQCRQEKSADDQ